MNSYITKPVSLKQLNHALEAAADMQLDRDMQLVINNEIDAPMIDFSHTDLNHRLAVHLADMAHQAKLHIENQAWKELSDVLHTIKGSAGLAGKKTLQMKRQI